MSKKEKFSKQHQEKLAMPYQPPVNINRSAAAGAAVSVSFFAVDKEGRKSCLVPSHPVRPRDSRALLWRALALGSILTLDSPGEGPAAEECRSAAGGALPRGSRFGGSCELRLEGRQHRSAFASKIARRERVLSQLISTIRSH